VSVSQLLGPGVLQRQLDWVAEELTRKFADRADQGEVHDAVFREASRYEGARVTQFIPALVEHAVHERLRQRVPGPQQSGQRAGLASTS
jgi:hypothetical protein